MTQLNRLGWIFLLVAPAPLLIEYFRLMWRYEEYRYFPVVFLAVGLLVFERWDRRIAAPRGYLAVALVVISLLIIATATLIWSPWLALVGWLCGAGAWFTSHREVGSQRSLVSLWVPCWLLLRLPLNLDVVLTSNLQQRTSGLSSYFLDRLQIPHKRNGNVFDLAEGQLFVEDACSGVQSLFALLFVATFIVVWQRRSLLLLPIYLFLGFAWAGVMNVVRIVAIGYALEEYQLDLAHGWRHDLLGYACLMGAVLLLLSSDRLLRVLFFDVPVDSQDRFQNPAILSWNRAFGARKDHATRNADERIRGFGATQAWALISLATVLLIFQLVAHPESPPTDVAKRDVFWEPPKTLLQPLEGATVANHQIIRGGDDIALGDNSDIWSVNFEGLSSRLAISQPYNEFHDLCVCYVANGWTLNERRVVHAEQSDNENWSYLQASFVREDGAEAVLFYSGLTSQGENLNPIDSDLFSRLRARVRSVFDRNRLAIDYDNLMVQLWTVSPIPLDTRQIAALRKIHLDSRDVVKNGLKEKS